MEGFEFKSNRIWCVDHPERGASCECVVLSGSAGERWRNGRDGAGVGSGEPHERRQPDQRSGGRLCSGHSAQTEGRQKQSKALITEGGLSPLHTAPSPLPMGFTAKCTDTKYCFF